MLCPFQTAALFGALVSATPLVQQEWIFSDPTKQDHAGFHFPTVHESTVMARRILHLTTVGTLVTSFPSGPSSSSVSSGDGSLEAQERRPAGVKNSPIGLLEYIADCEPHTGNPTILALDIATPFRNYVAGSNISLSLRWWPDQTTSYVNSIIDDDDDDDIPTPRTPAALPRFSLHGYLEPISKEDMKAYDIASCFLHAHPDSQYWQPGNDIHTSHYVRLVVEHVYWFGGFGDRARIEWLPIDDWRNVTMGEIAAIRLPGEQKKKERKGWFTEWKVGL